MKNITRSISRRKFLELSTIAVGGVLLDPWKTLFSLGDFPDSRRLGRVCEGSAELYTRPDHDSPSAGILYEDAVVPWLREVVGYWPGRNIQRFVETPEGYIWAPLLQPVQNVLNEPESSLAIHGEEPGMWVEVTVPYVDLILENTEPQAYWVTYQRSKNLPLRFYYSQILWVDQIKTGSDGNQWYRINERYGSPGDIYWARAEAFRPITRDEVAPISPEVEDKHIEIDINSKRQYLSCYEGNTEVYFCRISSGRGKDSTPLSEYGFPIWRKLFSIHMAGGTVAGGWDLPGIGWTSLFHGTGVAIHSTFWHNNYGEPSSHGCVNVAPQDAKWIFRWSNPQVPYETGNLDVSGQGGTKIIVKEW